MTIKKKEIFLQKKEWSKSLSKYHIELKKVTLKQSLQNFSKKQR